MRDQRMMLGASSLGEALAAAAAALGSELRQQPRPSSRQARHTRARRKSQFEREALKAAFKARTAEREAWHLSKASMRGKRPTVTPPYAGNTGRAVHSVRNLQKRLHAERAR